jgi:hypothetical protein
VCAGHQALIDVSKYPDDVELIAAIVWLVFGRKAEDDVVDLAVSLTEITAIVLVSVLLFGLMAVPLYRWLTSKLVGLLSLSDRNHPKV